MQSIYLQRATGGVSVQCSYVQMKKKTPYIIPAINSDHYKVRYLYERCATCHVMCVVALQR